MSPNRLRVNSTLPAPMKTILVMSYPFFRLSDIVANQAQTSNPENACGDLSRSPDASTKLDRGAASRRYFR
jgi:hypothetical protein